MLRAICTDGTETDLSGRCVVTYRMTNEKDVEMRNIQDDCHSMDLIVEPGETVLSAVRRMCGNIVFSSCSVFNDYGKCRAAQKNNFLHALNLFQHSIQSE